MATLSDLTPGDFAWVQALNDAHAAEVNALAPGELARRVATSALARVIAPEAAFLLAFDEAATGHGPNHQWFVERLPRFLYVDRVVVAAPHRGKGLFRALYEDAAARARAAGRPLVCEVNLVPPNPVSLLAHERLAFRPLGEGVDPRNGKHVRYLIRE